jgi:hypothetical protein
MKYYILIFFFQFTMFSQSKFVIEINDNFFSCTKKESVSQNSLLLNLPGNNKYSIKVTSGKTIIGREKITDFNKNKDYYIKYYKSKLIEKGWVDSQLNYEYTKIQSSNKSNSFVKFFIYTNSFTNTIPIGYKGIYIANGIYLLEIYEQDNFIESFYALVEKNKITKYDFEL